MQIVDVCSADVVEKNIIFHFKWFIYSGALENLLSYCDVLQIIWNIYKFEEITIIRGYLINLRTYISLCLCKSLEGFWQKLCEILFAYETKVGYLCFLLVS